MNRHKRRRAKAIQQDIREVLLKDWNPLGFPVPEDEYDGYINLVYHLLISGASTYAVVAKLHELGAENTDIASLLPVAEKLAKINVHL